MQHDEEIFLANAEPGSVSDEAGTLKALFESRVRAVTDTPVLVKFTGDLCTPCAQMDPVLKEVLAETDRKLHLLTVHVQTVLKAGITTETRRAFFRAVKGESPFPHLQLYRNGDCIADLPVFQRLPALAREQGIEVDESSGIVTGPFPAQALKTELEAFLLAAGP
jgi:thiol-disulfide isomerase/thioredoxin